MEISSLIQSEVSNLWQHLQRYRSISSVTVLDNSFVLYLKSLTGNKYSTSSLVVPHGDTPVFLENISNSKGIFSKNGSNIVCNVVETVDGAKVSSSFIISNEGCVLGHLHTGSTSHGAVDLGEYGGATFTADACGVIYTAELSAPKTLAFTDISVIRGSPSDAEALGKNFLHRRTFGEQSGNSVCTGLFYLPLDGFSYLDPKPFRSPVNYSLGQPKPLMGNATLSIGWDLNLPVHLGRVFCNNRHSKLFIVSTDEDPVDVLAACGIPLNTYTGVESPMVILAKDENGHVYFEVLVLAIASPSSSNGDDNHRKNVSVLRIKITFCANTTPVCELMSTLSAQDNFINNNVLVNNSHAPSRSIITSKDGSRAFLAYNALNGALNRVLLLTPGSHFTSIDLTEYLRQIFGFNNGDKKDSFVSFNFLAAVGSHIIVSASHPTLPPCVARISLESFSDETGAEWKVICGPVHVNPSAQEIAISNPSLPKNLLRVPLALEKALSSLELDWVNVDRDFVIRPSQETMLAVASIFKRDVSGTDSSVISNSFYNEFKPTDIPLIENVHGGPHSCTSTDFVLSTAFVALLGCAVLCVNYPGSIGFDDATKLPGRCGTLDVQYCIDVVKQYLKVQPLISESRIGVMGGSHGGFLSCHLIGQAPTLYKAACVRNPVTNLVSMFSTTDIPDWVIYEATGEVYDAIHHNKIGPTNNPTELYMSLMEKSPIIHVNNVKAHLLLGLGLKDQRVPSQQGFEYIRALELNDYSDIEKRNKHKLLVYPNSDHSLSDADSVSEWWPQTGVWILKHVCNSN